MQPGERRPRAREPSPKRSTQAMQVSHAPLCIDDVDLRPFEFILARHVRDLRREHALRRDCVRWLDALELGEQLGVEREPGVGVQRALRSQTIRDDRDSRQLPEAASAQHPKTAVESATVTVLVDLREQVERMRVQSTRLATPVPECTEGLAPPVHRARGASLRSERSQRTLDGL